MLACDSESPQVLAIESHPRHANNSEHLTRRRTGLLSNADNEADIHVASLTAVINEHRLSRGQCDLDNVPILLPPVPSHGAHPRSRRDSALCDMDFVSDNEL